MIGKKKTPLTEAEIEKLIELAHIQANTARLELARALLGKWL